MGKMAPSLLSGLRPIGLMWLIASEGLLELGYALFQSLFHNLFSARATNNNFFAAALGQAMSFYRILYRGLERMEAST